MIEKPDHSSLPAPKASSSKGRFHPAVQEWFDQTFSGPTRAQTKAWPLIQAGRNTLLLAPTGSGKTLAAFLVAIDQILFGPRPDGEKSGKERVEVLYISPLKALGVDVERNLRSPIAGVRAVAEKSNIDYRLPRVGVRSGDTPPEERRRLHREPPDILITTPESLYLLLTSQAAEILSSVRTVIIDEIHSLVGNKRGTHLFLSLERLEELRRQKFSQDPDPASCPPLQRIGLSATQRPLEEIARLLGGGEFSSTTPTPDASPTPRAVEIVDAGSRRFLDLRIEVPVEDMAKLAEPVRPTGNAAAGPTIPSIWPSIHPRLVELIRAHRSTMIFVNSRRLAERLATAINEVAEDEIALAHHGSIAKDTRLVIEDRLKRGLLPSIVATSSLELGIDMGAVDLVIQIEAPPSIASGIQRIGRAGHQVGARSTGVVFPKFRGDLLACSAAAARMLDGEVEETFYPRNPLDVLAQQLVAIVSLGPKNIEELYGIVRRAAPFFDLPRSSFESVLDLLSGRYPSSDFSDLKPRVVWDRVGGEVSPRRGAQRIAVVNGGTIPDRGLYGVFVTDGRGSGSRVGELDEEMVFESRPGDVFLLGASSWRVLEITPDRVLVSPAPGEPGRMPFWRGDGPGRPVEFGRAIGKLSRELVRASRPESEARLIEQHALEPGAARNLVNYLHDQMECTGEVPSDKTVVIESFLDEVGDWRVLILTPFGARIHAPWAVAVSRMIRSSGERDVDMLWSDDGIVLRIPDLGDPPDPKRFVPASDEIEDLVTRELGTTALFAARFRENAARALLLPRRRPGQRTPLWLQRRRSADLLTSASRYPDFPILLETYRECLRDVFDLPNLKKILEACERRNIRVHPVQTRTASPFASALLLNYTGAFLYEGDAPLAERRAATLALDHAQLRELLGTAELRELLDAGVIEETELELQRLTPKFAVRHLDALHELLLRIGDLSLDEIAVRSDSSLPPETVPSWIDELLETRRIVEIKIAGETRYAAAEDAARFRDAVGVALPLGLPDAFLTSSDDPLGELILRYARNHVPFSAEDAAVRFGLGLAPVLRTLESLQSQDRILEGEFLPQGRGREWCDPEVLRRLKRRSLARLRRQIEPVQPASLTRFLSRWQGLSNPRRGLDGLLDTIEQLQGAPLPASTLEREILPRRLSDYRESDLDELCSAGEVIWRGCEALGSDDGRVSLYLADHWTRLAPLSLDRSELGSRGDSSEDGDEESELCDRIRDLLRRRGALQFEDLVTELGGFRRDLLNGLWSLVWSGEVTNDTLGPLRSLRRARQGEKKGRRKRTSSSRLYRSRRLNRLPGSEGRWSLLSSPGEELPSTTERQTALAHQLLERYGVLTREMVLAEGVLGGFAGIYPVLKAMEEAGQIRRGYFVAGLGAAQFAKPGADDELRALDREDEEKDGLRDLAATDPANPYGAALKWPTTNDPSTGRPRRVPGALVILDSGRLAGYLGPTRQDLLIFPETENGKDQPEDRPRRLAIKLASLANPGEPVLLSRIDGGNPEDSPFERFLKDAGFQPTSRGYLRRAEGS